MCANGERRKSVYEEIIEDEITKKSGNLFGILDGRKVVDQLKSPLFYIMCLFVTIQMIRINYFVATIRAQEVYLIGPELGVKINNIFDIALPVGGVVAIPFIGLLLDNLKAVNVLMVLLSVSSAIGVLGLFSSFTLNLVGILLLVVFRPFFYTSVSDYSAKIFGFTTFGTVYGLMMCVSGICNYGQIFLDYVTHTHQDGNPTPVNIFLIVLSVVFGGGLVMYILHQSKHIERERINFEAERACEEEMPH